MPSPRHSEWTLRTDWTTGRHVPAGSAAPARSWAPPPQPGEISKRPLGFFETLDASFRVIRRSPGLTFGFAAIVMSLCLLGTAAAASIAIAVLNSTLIRVFSGSSDALSAIFLVVQSAAGILMVTSVPLAQFLGAVTARATRAAFEGNRITLRSGWTHLRGIRWRVIVSTAALIACLVVISALIFAAPVVILAFGQMVLAAVTGMCAAGLWLAASVFVIHRTMFVGAAMAVEQLGFFSAVRRSWKLTGPGFWRLLGQILVAYLVSSHLVQLITGPMLYISAIIAFITSLAAPSDSLDSVATAVGIVAAVLAVAASVAAASLLFAYWAALSTVLYFDARMRQEGFDLVLLREAEAELAEQERRLRKEYA